jgi:hypothetical protein
MSTQIKDGGPAFPHAQRLWDNDAQSWAVHSVGGMTLRDWFAGQALVGMRSVNAHASSELTAKLCWSDADAMLAAREKGQQ